MRHGTLKYLSRKLNVKCIEKEDETKNRKDHFTEEKRPFHNLHQTTLTASLLLHPPEGDTEVVTGAHDV